MTTQSEETGTLVSIESLTKAYGDKTILSELDLEVRPKDRIVVIGPSGGGKSTLLRCVMGLELIQGGSLSFQGQPYISVGKSGKRNQIDHSIQRNVGMVFQHYTLFPHLSVMANLLLAPVKSQKKISRRRNHQSPRLAGTVWIGRQSRCLSQLTVWRSKTEGRNRTRTNA